MFDPSMMLDFAYGMIAEGLTSVQQEELDNSLEDLDKEATVEVTRSDGKVIQISQARLARLQANARAAHKLNGRGGGGQ